MRKYVTLLAILMFTVLVSCLPPLEAPKAYFSGTLESKQTWTVMIHFAIDNNIDTVFERNSGIASNYLATLESIKAGDTGNRINIVLLMDCYNVDTAKIGWVSAFQDGYYHLTGGAFQNDRVVPIAEVNSGSLAETEAFMAWAVANYPADGYIYSIFNHGGGFNDVSLTGNPLPIPPAGGDSGRGIAIDNSSHDLLTHHELGQAVSYFKSRAGRNLDLFHAFACLMGGVELGYELKGDADYLLSSEEVFPADYWSYEALTSITRSTEPVSAQTIGRAFCDSAYAYFSLPSINRSFTLSLVDLAGMGTLAQRVDDYASTVISDINVNRTGSLYNACAAQSFSMKSLLGSKDFYYIDLGDYLTFVQNNASIAPAVRTQALAVQDQLGAVVSYARNWGFPRAEGMTIFHNIWDASESYPVANYKFILAFGSNKWADYVDLLDTFKNQPMAPDGYEPDNDYDTAKDIVVDAPIQTRTIHVTGDWDCIKVNMTAGRRYLIHAYADQNATHFEFYNSSRELIGSSSDRPSFHSEFGYDCPTAGDYYIRAAAEGTEEYRIEVRDATLAADQYEPDDSFAAAGEIAVGTLQRHTIHTVADTDFYKVNLELRKIYRIAIYPDINTSDTQLWLYGPSPSEDFIATDHGGAIDACPMIQYICPRDGTFYIRVNHYGYGALQDYRIAIQQVGEVPGSDLYEPDNDFTTTNTLMVGGPAQSHSIHEDGDVDFACVDMVAGCTYKITTYFNSVPTDTVLYLYDPARVFVTVNDNGGQDGYSQISYTCYESGRYFIRVDEKGYQDLGDYLVDVQLVK